MKKTIILLCAVAFMGCAGAQKTTRECGPFMQLQIQVGGVYKMTDVCVDELGEITWRISDRPLPPMPELQFVPVAPAPAAIPSTAPELGVEK